MILVSGVVQDEVFSINSTAKKCENSQKFSLRVAEPILAGYKVTESTSS